MAHVVGGVDAPAWSRLARRGGHTAVGDRSAMLRLLGVGRAGRGDGESLSRLVASSVDSTELGRWLVPADEDRSRIIGRVASLMFEWAWTADGVVTVPGDTSGVAVWLPVTGTRVGWPVWLPDRVHDVAGGQAGRVLAWLAVAATTVTGVGELSWVCLTLAVDPGKGGRGVGSMLVTDAHKSFDSGWQHAFVTTTGDGWRWWERFGYHRVYDLPLPDGGPVVTVMCRHPMPTDAVWGRSAYDVRDGGGR